jgi:hypothetical protein
MKPSQSTPLREPHIKRDHVDGPLLVMSDGALHWLTLWERICLALGWHDEHTLERKHWDKL